MKKLIGFSLCAAWFFLGCSVPRESNKPVLENKTQPQALEIVESVDLETDPYTVQSMSIKGDILALEVCYGGCQKHDWRLIAKKEFKKTNPPQLDLYLIHDQHEDFCKRQNCDTLFFDVSNAKYPGKNENYIVTLKLQNSNKKANYEY